MHIPYFADFYHICICKIDEIMPLKRTAFLSPKQRYTFQIPPCGAAGSLGGTGVPPAGMGGGHIEHVGNHCPGPPRCRAELPQGFQGRVVVDRGAAVIPWSWDKTLWGGGGGSTEGPRLPAYRRWMVTCMGCPVLWRSAAAV